MCGICGLVCKGETTPSGILMSRMLDRLYHRGPDGRGWFRDRFAALGHSRLSIIDISGGTQPLCNEDGSLWISFNGEIYNYVELRQELISLGHIFKTKSDTEVIIHSWESWGEDCFKRFNGQWAIALWDRREKTLILSRDRHGIRPLYYADSPSTFLFASEIKALFADESIDRSLSLAGLQEIFTFWGPVAPRTAFSHILEFPPGAYGIFRNGKLMISSYWNVEFSDGAETKNDYDFKEKAEQLREKLYKATKLRFERSDVPVGAYLSGGIDSSISSSIAMKYAREGLKTFSIGFSDVRFDEGNYQKEMVEYLGSDHSSLMVDHSDIAKIFPKVMAQAERPILRTAPAPLFLLSQLVNDSGYKVVVTGEGADEVLGGYDIFREAYIRNRVSIEGQTDETAELLSHLYPWMGNDFQKTPAFTKSFFSKNLIGGDPGLSHRPRWDNSRLLLPLFSSEASDFFRKNDIITPLLQRMPQEQDNWSYLHKAQWLEYTTLLPGYILSAQGDRMLMANSVEGRFPFLDVELDEFANRLHTEYKLNSKDLNEKHILKEAFRYEIPESILRRPKQPYQSPNGISFLSHLRKLPWLDEILQKELIEKIGIFNYQVIQSLFRKTNQAGNSLSFADNTRILFFISTMLVFKKFVLDNSFDKPKWENDENCFDFL